MDGPCHICVELGRNGIDAPCSLCEPCRGCTEQGWQGVVNGTTGVRYHERSVPTLTATTIEIIRCAALTTKDNADG